MPSLLRAVAGLAGNEACHGGPQMGCHATFDRLGKRNKPPVAGRGLGQKLSAWAREGRGSPLTLI